MISKVKLSPDGPEVSQLVYGTWRLLDDEDGRDSERLADRLQACVELGITTIDTAEIYGLYAVEEALGKALSVRPELKQRIEVVTKCGIDVPSPDKSGIKVAQYNATAKNLVACAEKSLRLLGVEALDVFLVHRPDWFCSADETAEGLTQLIQSGKIKHAGVSNYLPGQFELLADRLGSPPVTNQVEISLFEMGALYDGTLAQCERLRVRPMAWSPLGGGRLFDPKDDTAGRVRECMAELSAKYDGAGFDALAQAWVLAHPSRPVSVLGTNKMERILSSAKAGEIQMAREDWYALWEAAQGNPIP